MAKQKTPSPQEQYRARRAREETALLPPGLPNHGNTCFMNSVLQGLIATQHLEHLVYFRRPLASRRSPVLTNGHGLAGEFDHPWSDQLPIGDHFLAVLHTAWQIQNNRKRETVSPKDLLDVLGKKYDQYLDFRQQDAHEFLCQLLDAIRMEENDVIKQRSPPQRKRSRRDLHPADDQLLSFVDMLFGGKLASILVCQACKHVSHTYEDFSDLSLSMKPEDYVRERKRDRLKQFAKKIGTAFYVAAPPPRPRASSVPATPMHTSSLESPERTGPQRRRSIDLADVEIIAGPVDQKQDPGDHIRDDAALQTLSPPSVLDSPSLSGTLTDVTLPSVPISENLVPEPPLDLSDHISIIVPNKVNGKDRKDRDESWAKISRRITVSVGLTRRPKAERKDKKSVASGLSPKSVDEGSVLLAPVTPDATNGAAPPLQPERESTSLSIVNEMLQTQLTNVKRSVMPTQRSGNSPLSTSTPRFPLISRPASPGTHSKSTKPPRPSKPSAEESAYLRDILADINPPNIQKPFSIFKQSKDPSSTSAQNIFLKVNQINRIEECLRLFTSVEILDGENTVRCRRCWKIANGFYNHRTRGSAQDPDSCTDSDDEDEKDDGERLSPNSMITSSAVSSTASASHSAVSLQDTQISRDTPSILTQSPTCGSSTHKHIPPALQLNDGYPIELMSPVSDDTLAEGVPSVPPISTNTPGSPISIQTAKPVSIRGNAAPTQTPAISDSSLQLSLSAPSDHHRTQEPRSADSSNTESEISEGESETQLSVYSDISSAASTTLSPDASQEHLPPRSLSPSPPPDSRLRTDKKRDRHPSGVPRSRQFVLRPAYKRYLIATPPPILVVHLKRFQQVSKAPVVSFSTGFKKMDDYISFPEYLDLGPYLAPRREDYFDSKVAVTRGRTRRPTQCMYRLYAVVVHIGNMLGGHYVAYTALPPTPHVPETETRPESEKPRSENGNATANGVQSRDWAFISDTHVRLASLEEVLKSKAYVCMYERI